MPNSTEDLIKMISVPEKDLHNYLRKEVPDDMMETFFGNNADAVRLYSSVDPSTQKKGDSVIVFLPGFTGSVLENVGTDPEVIWLNPLAFLKGHFNHLDLASDGLKDASPGVQITAPRPVWIVYAKILLRLQHDYECYSFPYDWRHEPMAFAEKLRDFIDGILADSPKKAVTLVGHSMGGLVAMDYLISEKTKAHAERFVKRCITLGTPFRGTIEVVSSLARTDDPKFTVAKAVNKANDPQKMLRTLPSTYHLLPAPKGLYPDWDPLPDLDIWKPATWKDAGFEISEKHLAAAYKHHELLAKSDPQVPLTTVVGVYYPTPVKLAGKLLNAVPSMLREGLQGGDGSVEASSATFKDHRAYFVQEVHVELVLEDTVIQSIMSWVDGGGASGLVEKVSDVVQNDVPLRAGIIKSTPDDVANKVSTNQPLDKSDVRALFLPTNAK